MRYIITLLATATPALAEVPKVVTDIPPVHALVAQVMGDLGAPELLLARGADEHDFQLKPSQAGAVADADLVIWIGPELTPWLDSALDSRPEGAAALALLDAEGTMRLAYGAAKDAEGQKDEHGHEDEHGHAEEASAEEGHDHGHDHDHGSEDPHAWLDPGNAQVWLGLIAAELGRLDPDNLATYQANAAAAGERIAALDAELQALLAPVQGKPLVTFHDAYGYFVGHYGLTIAGSIALGDASSPGAARLTELRGELEAGGVVCIFPEVQHDPALVEQLTEGTPVKIGGALDPVGSSLEPGPDAYAALLTGMARTISDCALQ
ncbi:MAG: zinc ABC transporter substrate-binding protein [Tabrizicola sp.]|uniref:zinc ABC transporter substrate-binding protein n=1 Tax=Tabrizicola sp. TaxID=2005166 RepID=UPI002ABC50FA|nr:zinc ABC transporter substrate-binding protein [Tabrizicola sp.]MDZ4085169.1 zinc ABC transporter substrate-binding protein [Tabrizicola sp.]